MSERKPIVQSKELVGQDVQTKRLYVANELRKAFLYESANKFWAETESILADADMSKVIAKYIDLK